MIQFPKGISPDFVVIGLQGLSDGSDTINEAATLALGPGGPLHSLYRELSRAVRAKLGLLVFIRTSVLERSFMKHLLTTTVTDTNGDEFAVSLRFTLTTGLIHDTRASASTSFFIVNLCLSQKDKQRSVEQLQQIVETLTQEEKQVAIVLGGFNFGLENIAESRAMRLYTLRRYAELFTRDERLLSLKKFHKFNSLLSEGRISFRPVLRAKSRLPLLGCCAAGKDSEELTWPDRIFFSTGIEIIGYTAASFFHGGKHYPVACIAKLC